jgi:translation initiation factor 3 subunit G
MECITFETMGGSYQGLPKKPFVPRGVYVAPALRGGAGRSVGSDMRQRNNEIYVRVTNLSKNMREPDLYELFSCFGSVSKVYVSIDKNTDMCRGCGYVTFVSREDAQRAVNKLNGSSYNNLILKVEWPTPRTTYEGNGRLL